MTCENYMKFKFQCPKIKVLLEVKKKKKTTEENKSVAMPWTCISTSTTKYVLKLREGLSWQSNLRFHCKGCGFDPWLGN